MITPKYPLSLGFGFIPEHFEKLNENTLGSESMKMHENVVTTILE